MAIKAELEALQEFAPPPEAHKYKLSRAIWNLETLLSVSSKKYEGRYKEKTP